MKHEVHDVNRLARNPLRDAPDDRSSGPVSVIDKLDEVYRNIKRCHICPGMDPEKALRLTQAVDPDSDILVISQALAANQLRRSGVNFLLESGKLGPTGRNLEILLNQFGRSVYPYREVRISEGVVIQRCRPDFRPIYNTEIAQCYPGRREDGRKNREPERNEIFNCIGQGFLAKEIELLRTRLLLLMGKSSRDCFYKYFMKRPHPASLSDHISQIVRSRHVPTYVLNETKMSVIPIMHASGINGWRFKKMASNEELIGLIREVLRD